MNWILLIIAGLFEVGFATCLGKAKESTGNTSLLWYGGFLVCLSISMILLVKATKELPIGTAYAVWTGIGAVGSVLVGIIVFIMNYFGIDGYIPLMCVFAFGVALRLFAYYKKWRLPVIE